MANAEHVARLLEGVERWNAWRLADEGARPDLREARLAGADLREADLSGADLAGACLRKAKLAGAKLAGADLAESDLRGADLQDADLSGADLSSARLEKADLRGARLSRADLSDAVLTDARMPGSRNTAMMADHYERDQAMLSDRPRRFEPLAPTSLADAVRKWEWSDSAGSAGSEQEVRFTSYHPQRMRVGKPYRLLAYAHTRGAMDLVRQDRRRELGSEGKGYSRVEGEGSGPTVPRGTVITVVPRCEACTFWPRRRRFEWRRDWHRADFRMSVPERSGSPVPDPVRVRVSFFVGPVLLGETALSARVDATSPVVDPTTAREASAEPYRSIFVSYSHRDDFVVRRVREAARLLGDRIIRDVDALRSGDDWDAALLELIDEADVFQLYWSSAARTSPFVEREWRYALERSGAGRRFIRPLYWQKRMPEPPDELASLHFAFLDLGPWGRLRARASTTLRR